MTRSQALDWLERLLVTALYGFLVARLLSRYQHDRAWASLLLLPSEGLVVVFMLLRRSTEQYSRRPLDWLLAIVATCAPMLVSPGVGRALVPAPVGAAILVMGTLIQLHAKITLGRSFGLVPAHRGLQLAGPYRFVRHPMYAGYLLAHVAYVLMNPTAWNALLYATCYGLQIPRLLLEERLLAADERYRDYQQVVPYRLIPGIF